jgi:NAD(P)-dependent dehydrogenase (short-subunit alcohol dehydrogenase family)
MIVKGKVLILTGVGPGMGRRLALEAVREGARVALGARSQPFIEALAAEINTAGGEALALPTDVLRAEQCVRLAEATLTRFGRIDGLTNAAYVVSDPHDADSADLDAWQRTMSIICFGALRMVQAVVPAMKQQGAGSIVNISSMVTRKPPPQRGDYTVAKVALNGLTRQLAQELGAFGIRVNTTSIGWMWGAEVQRVTREMAASMGKTEAQFVGEITSRIPLGQVPSEEDCSRAVLFLLSDYSRAVTGAHLDVNGGESLGAF